MDVDEPDRIRIERVAGAISSPMLHAHDAGPAEVDEAVPAVDPEFETPWSDTAVGHPAWQLAAAVLALGVGATFASNDPRVGLVVVAALVLMRLVGSVDRRVPFSFGEGFVGYRSQMDWPQGVQEDDDFRWTWRPNQRPAQRISGR